MSLPKNLVSSMLWFLAELCPVFFPAWECLPIILFFKLLSGSWVIVSVLSSLEIYFPNCLSTNNKIFFKNLLFHTCCTSVLECLLMCVGYICIHMWRGPKCCLEFSSITPPTLFFESVSLNWTQSSQIWLVLSAWLLQGSSFFWVKIETATVLGIWTQVHSRSLND